MPDRVTPTDTTQVARLYAAVLMCVRLLRALLVVVAVTLVFFVLVFGLLWAWSVVTGLRLRLAGEVTSAVTGRNLVVGTGIVAAGCLALMIMGTIALALYRAAQRAAAAAGWVILWLSLLSMAGCLVDGSWQLGRVVSQDSHEQGVALLRAAQNLFPLYVSVAFTYASIGLIRFSRTGLRTALQQAAPKGTRKTLLHGLIAVPTAPTRAVRPRRRAVLYAVLALACEGGAFGTYFTSGGGSEDELELGFTGALIFLVLSFAVGVAIMYGLFALARWLWSKSRQAGQMSAAEALATDPRAPIVFLRSFADDQVTLRSARVPLFLRVMDPGVVARHFEELMIWNLSRYGPVVAIGRPRDVAPPVGAGREYVADHLWRDRVAAHLARARAIVMVLSESEGVSWELEQIRAHGYGDKSLLVAPPALGSQHVAVARCLARAGFDIDLNQLDPSGTRLNERLIACWSDQPGQLRIVGSSRPTELDYELALRMFAEEVGLASTSDLAGREDPDELRGVPDASR